MLSCWHAWLVCFRKMPPRDWLVQSNHKFHLLSISAHGVVAFMFLTPGAISRFTKSGTSDMPTALLVAYGCIVLASVAGALGAQWSVKSRPRFYELWTIFVWWVMSSIASYSTLLVDHPNARIRSSVVNIIIWKTWPTMMCRTHVIIPYLMLCLVNDFVATFMMRNWESTQEVEPTPVSSYIFTVSLTFAYVCIGVFHNHRMHTLYNVMAQLTFEKDAFHSLLTMVCDATVWIEPSSKTVQCCDKRFDMLMGKTMQGVHLSEMVYNPGQETVRLHRVFTQGAGAGYTQQPPVVLLPTTLCTSTGPADTDLFIVQNQVTQQPGAKGCLVGVRITHEQAGVPPTLPPTTVCGVEKVATDSGTRSIARSDGNDESPLLSCPSIAGSAPAVLVGTAAANDQDKMFTSTPHVCQEGGDCLPETAVAWVDNCPVPRPLLDLSAGERILCYDNVGAKLVYASIMKVAAAAHKQSTKWVKVTLEDGSVMSMTADHPVAAQSAQQNLLLSRSCRLAGDLAANNDKLLVLRMMPTLVTKVEHLGHEGQVMPSHNGWVTIEVEQPERHELLVSASDRYGMPGEMLAVSSCDRKPETKHQRIHNKNTFVCFPETSESASSRPNSAPPCIFRQRVSPPASHRNSPPPSQVSHGGTSDSGPVSESLPSIDGNDGNDPTILVGDTYDRLSDFIHWKKSGYPTRGSAHQKEQGECRPCSFHYTWLRMPDRRPPCKMSYLCDYCHDSGHVDGWRSRFRKRRPPKINHSQKGDQSLKVCL